MNIYLSLKFERDLILFYSNVEQVAAYLFEIRISNIEWRTDNQLYRSSRSWI